MLRRKTFTVITLTVIALYLMMMTIMATFYDMMISPYPPEVNKESQLLVKSLDRYKDGIIQSKSLMEIDMIEKYVSKMETPEAMAWFQIGYFQLEQDLNSWSMGYVNSGFWKVYDFKFLEGRAFNEQEEASDAPIAMISERLKDRYFGNEDAIGKPLMVEGNSYIVQGVFENIHSFSDIKGDVFLPYTLRKITASQNRKFRVILLADQQSNMPLIKKEMHDLVARIPIQNPEAYDELKVEILSHKERIADSFAMPWFVFVLLGGLFLALPASTLLNINTSRIAERFSEIGIRKAFGANIPHLVIQFLVENLVFSLVGGILGFLLSLVVFYGFIEVIMAKVEVIFPQGQVVLNWRVFIGSLVIALIYGFFTGLYPAWKMSQTPLANALKYK